MESEEKNSTDSTGCFRGFVLDWRRMNFFNRNLEGLGFGRFVFVLHSCKVTLFIVVLQLEPFESQTSVIVCSKDYMSGI
jgi:hypothetical protein